MMMKVCEQIDDQALLPEPSFLLLGGEHCLSEPREHGGIQISNSLSGGSHLSEPLPLSFANSTYKSSPFIDPSHSDLVGWGQNCKDQKFFSLHYISRFQ